MGAPSELLPWALVVMWALLYAVECAHSRSLEQQSRLVTRALRELLTEIGSMNRHGWKLDRTVWVKKYEGSRWEEAVVVAVSHKGALAVRRTGDRRAFWVHRDLVSERVRRSEPKEET